MRKFLTLLLLLSSFAAVAAPMTNEDVIKMVKGGLADSTVIQAIDAAEPGFDTSPDGLVRLKQGGVSDAVIQRIMTRKATAPAVASPAAAPAKPTAPAVASAGTAPANPAASACPECGTVTDLREVDKPGQASGVGAVAGGLLGGVLGRNLGGRDHRTAGTVVGAAGGALAGHLIEKKARDGKTWEIGVRFDDGTVRGFKQESQPGLQPGDRVRVVNGVVGRL